MLAALERDCAESGVPLKVEDATTSERVAALLAVREALQPSETPVRGAAA